MRLVSLFSGAGGLDVGLERAGFTTVAATDIDADAVATLQASQAAEIPCGGGRTYLQHARLIRADVAGLKGADLAGDEVVDLLAGGPPCQPFSSAGKQHGLDDPRGRLWEEFLRLASEIQPRMIVLENVRGLVTARGPSGQPGEAIAVVRDAFEDLGYGTSFALLNSADFGAPQRRVRLFMLAARVTPLPTFPSATHSRDATVPSLFERLQPWVPLQSVLHTDPDPADVVRPRVEMRRQLDALEPGTGVKAGGIIEANRPGGHWGYRQDGFLADPAVPSRTIRAATTPDWIRLADGSYRRLTWRECAALQGFPVEWRWRGSVTSRFRQIGNAVQTGVAEALGQSLRQALAVATNVTPASMAWPESFTRAVAYTAMEERVNGASRRAAIRAAR